MRHVRGLVALPLAVWLALGCSREESATGRSALAVTLRTRDPHVAGVKRIELEVRRDSVTVRDVATSDGQDLVLPLRREVAVPLEPGPVAVVATAFGSAGERVGDGDIETRILRGQTVDVTLDLVSARSGSRRAPQVAAQPDAGGPPVDAGATDAAAARDVAPPPADVAVPVDVASPADVAPAACTRRVRTILAEDVMGIDYGSDPRDMNVPFPMVSSGIGHNHVHDYVGWMRFRLAEVPAHARLVSLQVSLLLDEPGFGPPPLALIHSSNDGWSYDENAIAESIPRGPRVSRPLGPPVRGRASYAVDVELYARLWPGDLADDAVTLGTISTTPLDQPETWAGFVGLGDAQSEPELELVTCE